MTFDGVRCFTLRHGMLKLKLPQHRSHKNIQCYKRTKLIPPPPQRKPRFHSGLQRPNVACMMLRTALPPTFFYPKPMPPLPPMHTHIHTPQATTCQNSISRSRLALQTARANNDIFQFASHLLQAAVRDDDLALNGHCHSHVRNLQVFLSFLLFQQHWFQNLINIRRGCILAVPCTRRMCTERAVSIA
jgi:hypothetical protein